ncbi:hypothetical protein AQJ43_28625 [Streptomyces avermitilis]|nr:hypothetical protein AQJ43_28625 [Streptomyces avermitilis]
MLRMITVRSLSNQNIAGLDIPVHQIMFMSRIKSRRHLSSDTQRSHHRQRTIPVKQSTQIQPRYISHRDIQNTIHLTGLKNRHDMRMINRSSHP